MSHRSEWLSVDAGGVRFSFSHAIAVRKVGYREFSGAACPQYNWLLRQPVVSSAKPMDTRICAHTCPLLNSAMALCAVSLTLSSADMQEQTRCGCQNDSARYDSLERPAAGRDRSLFTCPCCKIVCPSCPTSLSLITVQRPSSNGQLSG